MRQTLSVWRQAGRRLRREQVSWMAELRPMGGAGRYAYRTAYEQPARQRAGLSPWGASDHFYYSQAAAAMRENSQGES